MSNRSIRDITIEELWQRDVKRSYESWVQPKSGDLLGDAKYFLDKTKSVAEPRIRARYGRAALVTSVAAIEALTNDALAAIYWLLVDSWPSEVVDSPPWLYFRKVSSVPVERLLKRGKLTKKIQYLLRHIYRVTILTPADDLSARLAQVVQARNRVVHMTYLWNPKKYPSVLRDRQVVYVANVAYKAASEYISFLHEAFEEIKLPIETIRPEWWFEEELTYPLKHPTK
jgi:hypothetical protein